MKIALFGSTGMIGQRVLKEAQSRGHDVTPLNSQNSDIFSAERVAHSINGSDLAISAFGPGPEHPDKLTEATGSLLAGVGRSGVPRLIAVGGAGMLEVAPGVRLIDSPQFPPDWKGIAQAHIDALAIYLASSSNWTLVCPAALIEPGTRTGHYRISGTNLLSDAGGQSRISAEDFASAILDEAEQPQHLRTYFGVAY